MLLQLRGEIARADLQVCGGQLAVALDLMQHLGKLVALKLRVDPNRRFLQTSGQVEKIPRVLDLTTTTVTICKQVQVSRLNLWRLAENDRSLDAVLQL